MICTGEGTGLRTEEIGWEQEHKENVMGSEGDGRPEGLADKDTRFRKHILGGEGPPLDWTCDFPHQVSGTWFRS